MELEIRIWNWIEIGTEICETSFSVSRPRLRGLSLTRQDQEALVSQDKTETEEIGLRLPV